MSNIAEGPTTPTADDIITAITKALSYDAALEIMTGVRSRKMLEIVADQLHIDPALSSAVLRNAIVKEARA